MSTVNADLDALRASLGTVSNEANTLLRRALDAATAKVRARNIMDGHWEHPDVQEAVILEASRLYKRRQSPEGVAGWGDLGVVRIMGRDPDVEALLAPHLDMCQAGIA